MEIDTVRDVDRIPRIRRSTDAREVALAVYDRLLPRLEALTPDDWSAPTECEGWDVADMVGHLIGAARSNAALRELVRQELRGRRDADAHEGNTLDAVNALQVREHAHLSPAERIATLRELAPRAVRGRMRAPAPMRAVAIPLDDSGSAAPGMPTRLKLAELLDVVYTRDVWLHTVDIARATGRPYEPDAPADRRIVEDVVAAWAERHDEPFTLTLTGPAGGRFRRGTGGGHLELDAVDLCRILSGRAEPSDPDVEVVADPADVVELLRMRVLF
jgi:uncharacterized protein (TIGR03083 family)